MQHKEIIRRVCEGMGKNKALKLWISCVASKGAKAMGQMCDKYRSFSYEIDVW